MDGIRISGWRNKITLLLFMYAAFVLLLEEEDN